MNGTETRWCPSCADHTAFEQPLCEDGHGADCLDLACTLCGLAIVLRDLTPAPSLREDARAA